jgi:hypothetical protein
MIKINKKLFIVYALFLVIILFVLTYTKRGHSYELDLYKSKQGWGYDILRNNKIYIHQPYIPAVEGQVPFRDKQSARNTGRLVIKKIRKHKSPAITKQELESLIKK